MGDMLGILLLTPALLIWRRPPQASLLAKRGWEAAALFGTAGYVGQFVLMGEEIHWPIKPVMMAFWLMPFLLWAALRLGRHGMTLLLPMFFVQNFWSVLQNRGLFAHDFSEAGLLNFWGFHLITHICSMTLAIALHERTTTERRVETERVRLQAVIDAIPDWILLKDKDGRFQMANAAFKHRLALEDSKLARLTAGDLLSPVATAEMEKQDQETLSKGQVTHQQCWLEFQDGTRELHDVRKVPLRDAAGSVTSVVCISRDITAEKQAERERELLYRAVTSSLNELYIFDSDTLRFRFVNGAALHNLGYTLAQMHEMTPLDLMPFHGEEDLHQLLAPLFMHTRHVQVFETMHRRKDGSLYPVEVHLQLFENDGGRHFMASVQDISKRLEDERALRLAASVFEHSKQSILITDAEVRIVSVNRMFTEVTGFSAEEAIGHNPRLLSSGTHDKAFYQQMWASILRDGTWSGEVWNRRKNGSLYIEWLDIVAVRDPMGRITNYIGLAYDITHRKAAEDSLRHLAQHDFLTGLPNRLLFYDRFAQALAAAKRHRHQFGVLFLDLDRFKHINDTLGHHFGDELLKAVAVRLTDTMRATDTISRLGGDEFIILIPEIERPEQAEMLLHKVAHAFQQPFVIQNQPLAVSCSIGYALYPDHGENMEALIKAADEAMYDQKRGRKIGQL